MTSVFVDRLSQEQARPTSRIAWSLTPGWLLRTGLIPPRVLSALSAVVVAGALPAPFIGLRYASAGVLKEGRIVGVELPAAAERPAEPERRLYGGAR
jgi:hypothetical protein